MRGRVLGTSRVFCSGAGSLQLRYPPYVHPSSADRSPAFTRNTGERQSYPAGCFRRRLDGAWSFTVRVFVEPIGKLRASFCNELTRDLELTIGVCSQVEFQLADGQVSILRHVANQARLAVERLKHEPMAERDVIQRVREIQRSIRELFGLFYYTRLMKKSMISSDRPEDLHPFSLRGC